jgi:hypothetical protein
MALPLVQRLKLRSRLINGWHTGVLLVIWALGATPALALPPPYVTDEKLAQSPIIVVGKWNRAPFKTYAGSWYDWLKDKVETGDEVQTELLVERVIKGDVRPGVHPLLVDSGVSWEPHGGWVEGRASMPALGDVKEVCDSSLWFLAPGCSWDKADRRDFLAIDTYRGVQPLALEAYFAALRSADPDRKIAELLVTEDTEVIHRVLTYLAGGILPWPYEGEELVHCFGCARLREPMRTQAAAVEKLLERKPAEMRRMAMAVYAELAAEKCVPRMRELLEDDDEAVRAIAAGVLVQRGAAEAEPIRRAMVGHKETYFACQVIDCLQKWGKAEAAPALIELLQADGAGNQPWCGQDLAALRARAALREITGCDFPTDVAAARQAWEKAKAIDDSEVRKAFLTGRLAYDPRPLEGRIAWEREGPVAILTNRSTRGLVVAKKPTGFEYHRADFASCSGSDYQRLHGKDDFQELAPGKTLRMKITVELIQRELLDRSRAGRLVLHFPMNGNEVGVNAWIGKVEIEVEAEARRAKATSRPG